MLTQQDYILTVEKPLEITQSTQSIEGQEIQIVILPLKEGSEIIEFN